MIAVPTSLKSIQPAQVVICQTSIRAKRRILEELISSIDDASIQQTFRTKIQQSKTRNELDQLAVDIYTTKDLT